LLVELVQEVIHGYFCNDLIYQALKQTTRPKFLHIGLSFTTMILRSCSGGDSSASNAMRESVLVSLLQPEFLKILVKNYQN
jgi:hypothetical protein